MNYKLEEKLNKIILWGIYITMFLPLFISPFLLLPDKFAKVVIFRTIVAVILIPFLYLAFSKKEYRPRFNALNISVAIFWFVGFLATIFSVQPFTSIWGSATRGSGFFNFTHYVIFFFILIGTVRTREQWKKIFTLAIAGAVLVSIFALLQKIIPAFNPEFMNSSVDRPSSTMGNPIMLANYLVMLVFITFAFWRKEIADKKRIFYFISGLLIFAGIFVTQTRGALLGLFAGISFFLLFYPWHRRHCKESRQRRGDEAISSLRSGIASLRRAKLGFARNDINLRLVVLFGILVVILLLFLFNSTLNIFPQRIFTLGNVNRLTSWQIAIEAIKDKPLFGWGPDNFAVPFDKYYPGGYTKSYLGIAETWWDKAHNVPLDVGVTTGLLGLVAYLGMFGVLFWKTYKTVTSSESAEKLIPYALAATFIAYFVQNLTSFDSVVSYILFFTLLAYLNVGFTKPYIEDKFSSISGLKFLLWVAVSVIILFTIIKISLIPFWLNYRTNVMVIPAREGNYHEAIEPYREITNKYQGKTYYEKELNEKFMKIAYHFAPSLLHQLKDYDEYTKLNKETINFLKRSAELEPLHTKHYYNIGLFYNNLNSLDPESPFEAINNFQKALELSPNREHPLVELAKTSMILSNYDDAILRLTKVININPDMPEPYLWLGIANLYKNNISVGEKYIEFAGDSGVDLKNMMTLKMLAGIYSDLELWEKTIPYYLAILEQEPSDVETRALLAGSYKKIGKITEAREQAVMLLEISPGAKESIEQFIKSL